MEHSRELENIKQEVEKSGKKIEALTKSVQNLSDTALLREKTNNLQENEDNILNRIETKVDVLAQTDYFELLNFTVEKLKETLPDMSGKTNADDESLNMKNTVLTNFSQIDVKLNELGETISDNADIESIKGKLNELSETVSSVSQFENFYEKLNGLCKSVDLIKINMELLSDNKDAELIKSKINYISSKLNDYTQSVLEHAGNVPNNINDSSGIEMFMDSLRGISEKLENNSDFYTSSSEDLAFLKENFYRINEKFAEVNLLIKTMTGENEELNNRFESNLTHFNSCFSNVYKQFNDLDNTFNNNFQDFKTCIKDVYDQFSTIDTRDDFDKIKLYLQSFNNKITVISHDIEELKEKEFSINLDKINDLEQKIDLLAKYDPTEIVNIFIESSKNAITEINNLKTDIEKKFPDKAESLKEDIQDVQNKIEFLNSNLCSLLDKFDNDIFEIRLTNGKILEETQEIKNKLNSDNFGSGFGEATGQKLDAVLDETKKVSLKISDEISGLVTPLSSAIELSCELNNSIKEILATDEVKIHRETSELLNRFENIYQNSAGNFNMLIDASSRFYEKIEDVKNEFGNISYDTNSKINEFLDKTDNIDLKIQNSLTNSENALDVLKNISEFAENQININSENLNSIKVNIQNISAEFDSFNTDINNVSSKLNKIIINEKESKSLSDESFAEIKNEIIKFSEENSKNMNKNAEKIVDAFLNEIRGLSEKVDKNTGISSDNIKRSEDIKKALAHMAGWFDTVSKLIEENNPVVKQNSAEKTNSFIMQTEENIIEQIKRISDRLSRFEVKLEGIESKVERIETPQSNREIINILSGVLEKLEITNERSKSNELILAKIESLEAKIKETQTLK